MHGRPMAGVGGRKKKSHYHKQYVVGPNKKNVGDTARGNEEEVQSHKGGANIKKNA